MPDSEFVNLPRKLLGKNAGDTDSHLARPALAIRSEGCWGRSEDVASLINPVLHTHRSATLVYGDSGIGKTTLLSRVVSGLNGPGVLVGHHETDNNEPDALLKAVDSLLKSIHTVDQIGAQAKIAGVMAVESLSLSSLKQFLLKIVTLGGKLDGKPLGGTFVGFEFLARAIGVAADAAEHLDLKTDVLPQLGIEEFRSILNILQKALPQNKFVLVIDNLNAAAGSLGREVPGLSPLSTISSYLSIDFRKSTNVHLILSWQRDNQNIELTNSLLGLFRKYGGEPFYLGPIKNDLEVAAWLNDTFRWYAKCSPAQQETVLRLASGFPEVIIYWRDNDPGVYDENWLTLAATSVKNRKYDGTTERLNRAAELDRKLLLTLAYLGTAQPTRVIADAIDEGYEDCRAVLLRWSDANLLLRFSESNDQRKYAFDHEIKRQIVLGCRKDLVENPEALCHEVYAFLLSKASRHGMLMTECLSVCLDLLSHSWLAVPKPEWAFLAQMLQMFRTERPPEGESQIWGMVRSVPLAYQGQYLAYSLHCGFGDRASILAAADSWIGSLSDEVGDSNDAARLANPLAHCALHLHEDDLYAKSVSQLRLLQERHPSNGDIAIALSAALAAQRNLRKIWSVEPEFDRLRSQHPAQVDIGVNLARLYQSATLYYTNEKLSQKVSPEEALACTRKLQELNTDYPESLNIKESFSSAIRLVIGNPKTRPEDGLWLVDAIRELWESAPDNLSIARDLAITLECSMQYAHRNVSLMSRYLDDIRALFEQFAHDPQIVEHVKEVNGMIMVVSSHAGFGEMTEEDERLFEATREFGKLIDPEYRSRLDSKA